MSVIDNDKLQSGIVQARAVANNISITQSLSSDTINNAIGSLQLIKSGLYGQPQPVSMSPIQKPQRSTPISPSPPKPPSSAEISGIEPPVTKLEEGKKSFNIENIGNPFAGGPVPPNLTPKLPTPPTKTYQSRGPVTQVINVNRKMKMFENPLYDGKQQGGSRRRTHRHRNQKKATKRRSSRKA